MRRRNSYPLYAPCCRTVVNNRKCSLASIRAGSTIPAGRVNRIQRRFTAGRVSQNVLVWSPLLSSAATGLRPEYRDKLVGVGLAESARMALAAVALHVVRRLAVLVIEHEQAILVLHVGDIRERHVDLV